MMSHLPHDRKMLNEAFLGYSDSDPDSGLLDKVPSCETNWYMVPYVKNCLITRAPRVVENVATSVWWTVTS